jgi:hypothetical protein
MKNTLLLILLYIFSVSCGDLFMQDPDSKKTSFSQFATCELNVEAFSHILKKNIKGDILCLKENLHLFMDTVETDRPGYISKSVLKNFVLDGPLDLDPDSIGIIDSVFDLSHLIIGTERDYIVRSDVDILLDFLVFFNEHIWKSYKFFMSEDDINYSRHLSERQTIFNEVALIAQELKQIYRPNRSNLDRVDLEQFIFNFFKNEMETLENIRSMMFLKRVFLGGQIWELSHIEFADVLESLPHLVQVAFDMAKVRHYEFNNEQETLIKVFQKDIDVIKNFLYFDADSHESVFTIYDLINLITTMAPDFLPIDIAKYPREIIKIKEIFLGSGQEIVSARELIDAFDHGNRILAEANLFYRVYDFYRDELDSPYEISHNFSDFPVSNSQEKEFLNNFARIVHNYKFLKGDLTSAFYTFDYRRNANAFFETGALEYAAKMVMSHYGKRNPGARGGYDMTLDETVTLVDDFKWFLRDQGIVTIGRKGGGEVANVADNFVLMSTLFQYQSDGCDPDTVCMEIPEVTEFLTGLLTAVEVKDFFTETMLDLCSGELDQYDRIAPECFRRNFINVIETEIPGDGRALADYMPLFYEYLKGLIKDLPQGAPITDSDSFMHFIGETEAFTRSCMHYDEEKTEEVYLKANDAFAVFAGLLNVESTLLRFDLDLNNKIDAQNKNGKNEVLNAYYEVYKGALIAMVKDIVKSEMIARLTAKPIFQYLVKYGEVPDSSQFRSIWRFVKFILKKNKKADISRATVATILKTIGQQSENASLHPFKCEECLRDPTVVCEPEGDPWEY